MTETIDTYLAEADGLTDHAAALMARDLYLHQGSFKVGYPTRRESVTAACASMPNADPEAVTSLLAEMLDNREPAA